MSSFTDGTTAVVPNVVVPTSAARESRHVFQPLAGGGEDVWTQVAGPRVGTFTAVFSDHDLAAALFDMLSGQAPVTYADADDPGAAVTFLADGQIAKVLDQTTQAAWIVTVDYREVTP